MIIRRESPADQAAVRAVHVAAFPSVDGGEPLEAGLLDALRLGDAWIPELSWVACSPEGEVVGHVVATRGRVGGGRGLGIGPLAVVPAWQGRGVGTALMHALIGAADALGEPMLALLGEPEYYARFGFGPASALGVESPDASWGDDFQVRTLSTWAPSMAGPFVYAEPFASF